MLQITPNLLLYPVLKLAKLPRRDYDIEIVTCFSYFFEIFLNFFRWLLTAVKSVSCPEDACNTV